MFRRLQEIFQGVAWAFRFDNPAEILVTRHLLRRKEHVIFLKEGKKILVDTNTSDGHVVNEVLLEGMYDSAIRRAAASSASPFRYLNLGANIGTFDLRVSQLVGPSATGLSVEMNPACWARLVINLELNRLWDVQPVLGAAWDKGGTVEVPAHERDTGQQCRQDSTGWPVPLLPWNDLFAKAAKKGDLDLVKIDIEGAEEQVIPCLTPEQAARIRFLVLETHGPDAHACCQKILTSLEFTCEQESAGEGVTLLSLWQNKRLAPHKQPPNHE